MTDQIRYDLLTQQALRGVVRGVLTDAAKKGLPGDHHFFIEFDTHAAGVRMSNRLHAQHPDKMTIILQHQFWDLAVTETAFEVGLSFGGITERLAIPFEAITGFYDPSVQFGLQFEDIRESQGQQAPTHTQNKLQRAGQGSGQDQAQDKSGKRKHVPSIPQAVASPETSPAAAAASDPEPDKPPHGGGEVVRLDRFRKK
jgi:hypothetical protein